MEERYELRGKIGQGGIGRVHRAFDHRMKREVAIKRILTSEDDPSLKDEATKQLMVEAGALASLQHPNIITVHDVGADDEGPYVVMELIAGKTLDEIIEQSPLTWDDFKMVATQSLEALIAAQELNMIHSDLKPPNIMLTWLPSGTFQVKIVDFGLATLIQNQSPEEIAAMDSVFGSVFFMPPEQFERVPLDTRSDLYSLGCCLYQALTGAYPFTGSTGAEVMEAHLNHQVIPIQEIRADIPLWACQWVMWLINRNPDDRPESAREALSNFLQNDKDSNPALSQGGNPSKTKLILPGAAISATGLVPTPGAATSPLSTTSVHLGTGQVSTVTGVTAVGEPPDEETLKARKKKKILIIGGAAAGLAILITLIVIVIKRNTRAQEQNAFENIAILATTPNTRDVKLTRAQLQIIFDFISKSSPTDNIDRAYIALQKTTASDGTDVDAAIVDYTIKGKYPEEFRIKLFQEVIAKRRKLESVAPVLAYCEKAPNDEHAMAAYESVRPMIREQDAKSVVAVIANSSHKDVIEAAEVSMEKIINFSRNKSDIAQLINDAKGGAKPSAEAPFKRLLELCAPKQAQNNPSRKKQKQDNAANVSKPQPAPDHTNTSQQDPAELQALLSRLDTASDDELKSVITDIGNHPSELSYQALVNHAGTTNSPEIRLLAIQSLVKLAGSPDSLNDENQSKQKWKQIIWRCGSYDDRTTVVDGLAQVSTPWALELLKEIKKNSSGDLNEYASVKIDELAQRIQSQTN